MDEVMKKRLVGVMVLVAIGVCIPLLVSRCSSGASSSDNSAMRVYEIGPNGKAQAAAGGAGADQPAATQDSANVSASGRQADNPGAGSEQAADLPEAISPDSVPRTEQASAADNTPFSTPPVHGNSRASANSQNQAASPAGGTRGGRSAPAPTTAGGGSEQAARGTPKPRTSADSGGGSLMHTGSPGSGWIVQVASFGKADNAKRLAGTLKDNFDAFYRSANVHGNTYYRVAIGPFAKENAARGAAARLRQQGRKPLVRHLP